MPGSTALAELDTLKTPAERRAAILRLEAAAFAEAAPEQRKTLPLRHHFAPGQYAREAFLEAGDLTIGKIHRHAHINVVSMGNVLVYTEAEGWRHITAPDTFVSVPGTKRVVLPLEDTLWTTVHANPGDERDIAVLEERIIAPSYEALGWNPPAEIAQ